MWTEMAVLGTVSSDLPGPSNSVAGDKRDTVHAKTRVEPEYPSAVLGLPLPSAVTCTVHFRIDEHGMPETIEVPKPCPDVFKTAAETAARQWTFYPYEENSTPLKAKFELEVVFKTPQRYVDLDRSSLPWSDVSAHLNQVVRRRNAWAIPLSTVGLVATAVGAGSLGVALARSAFGEPPGHAYQIAAVSGGAGLPLLGIGVAIGASTVDPERAASTWNEQSWTELQAGFAK